MYHATPTKPCEPPAAIPPSQPVTPPPQFQPSARLSDQEAGDRQKIENQELIARKEIADQKMTDIADLEITKITSQFTGQSGVAIKKMLAQRVLGQQKFIRQMESHTASLKLQAPE